MSSICEAEGVPENGNGEKVVCRYDRNLTEAGREIPVELQRAQEPKAANGFAHRCAPGEKNRHFTRASWQHSKEVRGRK